MALSDLTSGLRDPTVTTTKFVPKSVTDTMVEFFIDPIEGQYARPAHLRPIVEAFDAAVFERKALEVVAHAPPRHGKSMLALAAILTAAIIKPGLKHAYAAYNG